MDYECIGICEVDPETGICQGCGRPLWADVASPLPSQQSTDIPAGQIAEGVVVAQVSGVAK